MSRALPFTQAARPSRDEIELARLQLSKIYEGNGDGAKHTIDLRHYTQEDINALFRRYPQPSSHAIRVGFIYVAGFAHFVKIGWTTEVKTRIYSIEQGLPETLVLFHSRSGTQKDERVLHKRFATVRTRGEWFRREGALAEWIDAGCPL